MAVAPARGAIGAPLDRVDGLDKVQGKADYAFERHPEDLLYGAVVQSPHAKARVTAVADAGALALPGVRHVLHHGNAPALEPVADGELSVLQSDEVAYRGQAVALVLADSLEAAREAAGRLAVDYEPAPHDVLLRDDHPGLYAPDGVNGGYDTDSVIGDVERGFAEADVVVDRTYATPTLHNNAMEPHAAVAQWDGGDLVLHDSSQGTSGERSTIAKLFGLDPARVRVISHHVGGGFGSKGTPRPHAVLAALGAKIAGRPVKLALTRRQMFSLTGYRTPTIQRVRLGAKRDGTLVAIEHDAVSQSSHLKEFTEQTATATRVMYAGANRRTTHRLARLDVPTPSWMRAPGECPGMYALEAGIDELAHELGMDPVELRIVNDPPEHPENGKPWSSRHLVECLREGAERFGWAGRPASPGERIEGRSRIGYGVAASMYPTYRAPAQASVKREADGTFTVRIAAADIGTGARTVLTQIAADALETDPGAVRVELGDSALPRAGVAGGSMGTGSWGSAVHKACRALIGGGGDAAQADTTEDVKALEPFARHAFGAQFAEVHVDADTAEVRVTRLLGVFAAGRIINPKTARSQLIGGMTMGLGMALMEASVLDHEFGDWTNQDLAGYHVPACADVLDIQAHWIAEDDDHLNPMGSKGIGEIGITGTAAAIANAVFSATGTRVRALPIQIENLLT
jgi:xanthine dehydrogenase YagR molybdenum-binding subunit